MSAESGLAAGLTELFSHAVADGYDSDDIEAAVDEALAGAPTVAAARADEIRSFVADYEDARVMDCQRTVREYGVRLELSIEIPDPELPPEPVPVYGGDCVEPPNCGECGEALGRSWQVADAKAMERGANPADCPHCGENPLPHVGADDESGVDATDTGDSDEDADLPNIDARPAAHGDQYETVTDGWLELEGIADHLDTMSVVRGLTGIQTVHEAQRNLRVDRYQARELLDKLGFSGVRDGCEPLERAEVAAAVERATGPMVTGVDR